MSSTVWFGLLGPVDIRLDGVPVPLPSARTRALLAALLCQPNRVVSVDGLVDAVWGADPPDGALTTLRSHVMRLRRCLGPEAGRLQTAAPGYRLLLDPATELDTKMFVARHQAGQVAAAAGDWRSAARYAAEALALWRGEPLADVPSEQLQLDEAAAWAELRVEAIELRARADISLGRPADAAAAMRRLAADHPHREPAYALLMAALAAADRRAEALKVYRLLRTVLVRDLGMEPSPELRALQQRILAMDDSADDAADVGGAGGAGGADDAGGNSDGNSDGNGDGTTGDSTARDEASTAYVAWPPPHTLPRDVADFTGRDEQLRRIADAVIDAATDAVAAGFADAHAAANPCAATDPQPAFAAVIDGMAGIGKSALAVHAAHQLSDRFPDGQLYADLLGTSPEPAEPRAVLASFLRLLGISPAELPEPDMERAALYRSLLAGRR
ncbi:winged helix-turn-helix domain-containing protein, partial [Catenulispora sp. NF23]|uniref:AfsR/SARP family transcriptional regulator n=1 Tax=Catenulispora pinistramenti TaxID=2705254 RepID=UPI001BA57F60